MFRLPDSLPHRVFSSFIGLETRCSLPDRPAYTDQDGQYNRYLIPKQAGGTQSLPLIKLSCSLLHLCSMSICNQFGWVELDLFEFSINMRCSKVFSMIYSSALVFFGPPLEPNDPVNMKFLSFKTASHFDLC